MFKIIAKVLAQNGHNVWVITNNVKGETYEETENLKIITVNPTLEYKGGLPPTFLDNIRYTLNAFQKGKKIVKWEHKSFICIPLRNYHVIFVGVLRHVVW